jgi:hypothetical protein
MTRKKTGKNKKIPTVNLSPEEKSYIEICCEFSKEEVERFKKLLGETREGAKSTYRVPIIGRKTKENHYEV